MRVVAAVAFVFLEVALAVTALMAPQPIVSILQPFAETGAPIGGAFSLANPNDPADPYLIFSPSSSASGLRVIKRSLVSPATTSNDFVIINDKWCPVNDNCTPLTVVPFKNGTEVCWVTCLSAGCADLSTGNVAWNEPLPLAIAPNTTNPPYIGVVDPAMLWYQTTNASYVCTYYLIDLTLGKVVEQTWLNSEVKSSSSPTVCISSKLCVMVTIRGNRAHLFAYRPAANGRLLWVLPLPATPFVPTNFAVGTASNGNTMIVFADGTGVYGVDATLGVLKFNVSYSGAPYNASYREGESFAGICGGAIVVLGRFHVYMLSLETGERLSLFAASSATAWGGFGCYRDTHFYVGGYDYFSDDTRAFFGVVTASTAAVTTVVQVPLSTVQVTLSYDGERTVFFVNGDATYGYDIETGTANWMSTAFNSSAYRSFLPVRAVGTSLCCIAGTNDGVQVQCFDASADAAGFARNHPFIFGVANDTVVVGPSAGDGPCVLDATTLELITAVGTGEFETETRATPIIATTPTGLEVAIIVASIATGDCVRSYDRHSGALLWNYCLGPYVYATPVASREAVFILDSNSMIRALNMTTGEELWRHTTSGSTGPALDRDFTTAFFPVNASFTAVSALKGTVMWVSSPIVGSLGQTPQLLQPVVVGGAVYGCGNTTQLQCQRYDAVTGRNTSAVASILNPSSTPQLVEYDGRFFVNAIENTFVNGSRAGLYEIDFDNITRTRQVITLPPMSSGDLSVDAIFVGIADGLVAFQILTTASDYSESNALQIWWLRDMTVVWGLESSFLVGAVNTTITVRANAVFSIFGSPELGVLAVLTTDFIMAYDWHTGAILRILGESPQVDVYTPLIGLTTAGNGTLLRTTGRNSAPYYLMAYSNLRTPSAGTDTPTSTPAGSREKPHSRRL